MTPQSRFIVLSYGRTGSTYLAKEVNRTKDIRMYYEVFHPKFEERNLVHGQRFVDGKDSWAFVEESVFAPQPDETRSVGFKLFYYHARGAGPECRIWDELPNQPEIDIVLLGRKNIFAAYVSEIRARQTSVWHPTSAVKDTYGELVAITIDPTIARRYMLRTKAYQISGESLSKGHRTHVLNYEDFVADGAGTVKDLVRFLGSQDEDFTPGPFLPGSADKSRTKVSNLREVAGMLREIDCEWMIAPYA